MRGTRAKYLRQLAKLYHETGHEYPPAEQRTANLIRQCASVISMAQGTPIQGGAGLGGGGWQWWRCQW